MKPKISLFILMIAILFVAAYVYYKSSSDYEYKYSYFGGKVKFTGRYRNSVLVFGEVWVSLADFYSTSGKPPEFFKNDFKIFIRNKSVAINDFTPDEIIKELDKSTRLSDTEYNYNGITIREVHIVI